MPSENTTKHVYDVLGIGFGPANLSIAAAFAEQNLSKPAERRLRRVGFVEAHSEFKWHPGMMIPGSRMQISFLKDLATMRNPTSPFTFLNYLASQKRLVTFINRSTFTPTRREFADYMAWVAAQVVSRNATDSVIGDSQSTGVDVFYNQRVTRVEAVLDRDLGGATLLRVWSAASASSESGQPEPTPRLCRNLIISTGGQPSLPPALRTPDLCSHPRVIHTSQFLDRIDSVLASMVADHLGAVSPDRQVRSTDRRFSLPPVHPCSPPVISPLVNPAGVALASGDGSSASVAAVPEGSAFTTPVPVGPIRIAVMGGGQSAAETFMEIRSRLASLVSLTELAVRPRIDLIIRKTSLHPSDDSPFSNEIFDPSSTDFFYDLGEDGIPIEKAADEEGQPMVGSRAPQSSGRSSKRGAGKTRRQVVLGEALSTNYAVVNPNTLETVYEAMYAQRVEEDIYASSLEAGCVDMPLDIIHDPKLSLLRHTEIVRATPVGSGVELILGNVLTGDEQTVKYDAVILGTGYIRQGWRDILFGDAAISASPPSQDGVMLREFFGCGPDLTKPASGQVSSTGSSAEVDTDNSAVSPPLTNASLSLETSDNAPANSTATSQASLSMPGKSQPPDLTSEPTGAVAVDASREKEGFESKAVGPFGVTRKYRLVLPERAAGQYEGKWFRPKVWLQGSNEQSHGISDSLLSVLAVRSAEVVDDIESIGNL